MDGDVGLVQERVAFGADLQLATMYKDVACIQHEHPTVVFFIVRKCESALQDYKVEQWWRNVHHNVLAHGNHHAVANHWRWVATPRGLLGPPVHVRPLDSLHSSCEAILLRRYFHVTRDRDPTRQQERVSEARHRLWSIAAACNFARRLLQRRCHV